MNVSLWRAACVRTLNRIERRKRMTDPINGPYLPCAASLPLRTIRKLGSNSLTTLPAGLFDGVGSGSSLQTLWVPLLLLPDWPRLRYNGWQAESDFVPLHCSQYDRLPSGPTRYMYFGYKNGHSTLISSWRQPWINRRITGLLFQPLSNVSACGTRGR